MSDLDEFMKTVLQEIRDGMPLMSSDDSLNTSILDSVPTASNLEGFSDASSIYQANADLLPPEGSKAEADLMRIMEVWLISIDTWSTPF